MEEINCIFCNIKNDKVVIEENGFKGRQCTQCGLIYISPRPKPNEIIDLYCQDHAYVSLENSVNRRINYNFFTSKHHFGIIKKYLKWGSFLEIGPGNGDFISYGKKIGFDVSCIELNPIQAKFLKTELSIPCEETPLNNASFSGKKFDIIFHRDVLSHFYDPIAEFQRINEKLGRNGLVIFETGSVGDINKIYFKYFEKFSYPDHMFFFNEHNLKDLLMRTNFEFVGIYRYSLVPELIFNKIIRDIRNRLKRRNVPKSNQNAGSKNCSKNQNEDLIINFLKSSLDLINFMLRYKIGFIIPKKNSPQTMIIIAKKKS